MGKVIDMKEARVKRDAAKRVKALADLIREAIKLLEGTDKDDKNE